MSLLFIQPDVVSYNNDLQPAGWEPVLHDWAVFYNTWWCKPPTDADAANLEKHHTVVVVGLSRRVQVGFGIHKSQGRLLVREEYLRLFKQLCDFQKNDGEGVLIVGQPGIGASFRPRPGY